MNQILHYSTVVLGATAFGCAYACSHPETTAVVEESLNVCGEFCGALRADPLTQPPQTGFGAELFAELQQRNLVNSAGEICIPAVSGLFSRRLLQSKAAVYLQCRLAETKKQNGRFVLTVFGPDGFFTLSCDRILDTRTKALPQTVQRQYAFCAMLAGKSGEFTAPPKALGPLQVRHGRFSDEYILRLPLKKPLPLPLAAEQLTKHWAQHQNLAPGLKIAAFATRLEERLLAPYCREENGVALVPSAGYENLLTAAAEGFLWNFAH